MYICHSSKYNSTVLSHSKLCDVYQKQQQKREKKRLNWLVLNIECSLNHSSYQGNTQLIKSQVSLVLSIACFTFYQKRVGGKKREEKWSGKAEFRKMEFLRAGEAWKIIFWPAPGFTVRTSDNDSSGFSSEGTSIPAPEVPCCMFFKERREGEQSRTQNLTNLSVFLQVQLEGLNVVVKAKSGHGKENVFPIDSFTFLLVASLTCSWLC